MGKPIKKLCGRVLWAASRSWDQFRVVALTCTAAA